MQIAARAVVILSPCVLFSCSSPGPGVDPVATGSEGRATTSADAVAGRTSCGCVGDRVCYCGGPLVSDVHIVPVLWGEGVDLAVRGTIIPLYRAILGNNYLSGLAEYERNGAHLTSGSVYGDAPILIIPGDTRSSLPDAAVAEELGRHFEPVGDLPRPSQNIVYVVHLPPGVTVQTSDGIPTCARSGAGVCSLHSSAVWQGAPVYYVVIPDYGPGSVCATSYCGSADGAPTDRIQNFTSASSHELAEALTDPDCASGWADDFGNEIGDKCNRRMGTIASSSGAYSVQYEWSQELGQCSLP